ncbi:hypothetical protein GCM10023194_17660 [Planotetraspora phitsanulokensis]|uniref:Uncharacterized protein n=1 Tax=Planotetraspora phitsanulokensis TaxID=575192 RepID=A0A8J3U1D1_9ACTN|nr:hypothetical protein Pph01_01300 [Planotetraspora phitsanulokensis]
MQDPETAKIAPGGAHVKTRIRTLRIGDQVFAWTGRVGHTTGDGACRRYVRLRVWGGGKNGRPLQADLLSTFEGGPWGYCATDTAFPTPRDVRVVVDHALASGWDPAARGGVFLVQDNPSALTGFVITDR